MRNLRGVFPSCVRVKLLKKLVTFVLNSRWNQKIQSSGFLIVRLVLKVASRSNSAIRCKLLDLIV